MKRFVFLLMSAVFALLLLFSCSKPEQPLSAADLLDLGEKYLLELDYEQAIVQFLRVIEVEPMNPRGYIGAAEAYIGLGESENAIAVLEQGLLQIPGNIEITMMLDELKKVQNTLVFQIGNPNVTINGVTSAIDSRGNIPENINGSMMLPLRSAIAILGGTVEYDSSSGTTEVTYNETIILLVPDSEIAVINGAPTTLPTSPALIGGEMYVPARLISELIDGILTWDSGSQSATLVYSGKDIDMSSRPLSHSVVPINDEPDWHSVYGQYLDAYYTYAISGFTQPDKSLIGDNVLVEYGVVEDGGVWIMFEGTSNRLAYCFHDIDGNGVSELLIAAGYHPGTATSRDGVYYKIYSIYSVINGNPVSLLQKSLAPYEWINILSSGYINVCSGRMGYYNDAYYSINADGMLVELESISYETHSGDDSPLVGDYPGDLIEFDWLPILEYHELGTDELTDNISEYILPYSNTRRLTNDDLDGLTKDLLKLARNEIFARYGRQFSDPELQAYFNSKSWYANTVKLPLGTEPELTELEKSNIAMIQEYESRVGAATPITDSGGLTQDMASAYLAAIESLTEKHGEGHVYRDGYIAGVGIVRLVDFNGDGAPELMVAYADDADRRPFISWLNIYGYDNELVVLLDEWWIPSQGSDDADPRIELISNHGKVYIEEFSYFGYAEYYTLQDEGFVSVFSWSDNNYAVIHNPDIERIHILNGDRSSEEEVRRATEEFLLGSTRETIIMMYPSTDLESEINITRNTIAALYAKLAENAQR